MLSVIRICFVTLLAWTLWVALIAIAFPSSPDGLLLGIFMASFVPLYAGSLWAIKDLIPSGLSRNTRWTIIFLIGNLLCLLITYFGHMLGLAVKRFLG